MLCFASILLHEYFCMKTIKFLTPFILAFPVCIFFAIKTWLGHFTGISLYPNRSPLFIAMAFTMIIIDLFLKYLVGKDKVYYVWIIEAVVLIALCIMIIPKIYAEQYVG